MQERDVAAHLAKGKIQSAVIYRHIGQGGWTVMLQGEESVMLQSRDGNGVRVFEKSDDALHWCERAGFSEVSVSL